ncbi:efflux RND transporter permease subunit [Candidatus Magnetominusculus xianensis]|uniref:Multidrug transporter AcrB n=1 Tax=Candidatus Magnetominusculus xianensis TaxID=1748249 RepID=A0ABR5SK12_9BACT|nr:efflux RND transporter permease subunit [Candidatus Magnetominusculus xianensis]KWT92920.1 multidrug transporter AcrB [Candidatus Magnetominusculus xianensis]MBF0402924.1 efflux RND transporter permease subunit [Nitrospirota bacterium]
MHGKTGQEIIENTHNTARFFTEHRHVSWVFLFVTIFWGILGYMSMPKLKDPDVPVRVAQALCSWPGAKAVDVEQLVTRRIEEKIAQNPNVKKLETSSRGSISVVTVELTEKTKDTGKEFSDINLKLNSINDLPEGAGPIVFVKDYGDTDALMITVASPLSDATEIALRAKGISDEIKRARSHTSGSAPRAAFILNFPYSLKVESINRQFNNFIKYLTDNGVTGQHIPISGAGFIGLDMQTPLKDEEIIHLLYKFAEARMQAQELHPDIWMPVVIRDPSETEAKISVAVGSKYSYRELDDFTDTMQKHLQTVPEVAKVNRTGVLNESIYLHYSQLRLASYGTQLSTIKDMIDARNAPTSGGRIEVLGKIVNINPSSEFKSAQDVGDVIIHSTQKGVPVYLRDLVDISREYDSPPSFLNTYGRYGPDGKWISTRAITVSIQMRKGEKIGKFGETVQAKLDTLRKLLPNDLVISRVSDQPQQVSESIDLFMQSLYEAIVLVIVVALIGFWDWRSAFLMALSIPVTLFMTFGMMFFLGIDVQQVSVASLIIALGLLVDDPVVAGDAITNELNAGQPPLIASWLGPTKLANAIMYATVTNIVAYLPFLLLPGDTGTFIYSLPIVLACSLIASRVVSMTFIPMLSYYLLRPKKETKSIKEGAFAKRYYAFCGFAIDNRKKVFVVSVIFIIICGFFLKELKTSFFPKDLSYLSYVDIWLPVDSPLSKTSEIASQAEGIIRETTEKYGKSHPAKDGKPRRILDSLTTFAGGGGPRFWFTVSPEAQQQNYAQIIIKVNDKHDTGHIVDDIQKALTANIFGAMIDVRQLETGVNIGAPVAVRIIGDDIPTLRKISGQLKTVFSSIAEAERIRDNLGEDIFSVRLSVDGDRANLAGVTNRDVATSALMGINGYQLSSLREGHKQIPITARLRMDERAQLSDIQNLYVFSSNGKVKVPVRQVSSLHYGLETEEIYRRNQFRTIIVSCYPIPGVLPSEVLAKAEAKIDEIRKNLPPGYVLEIGGEHEEQSKGFNDLAIVLIVSILLIFIALVMQFKNAIKPLVVFAAIPYGIAAALISLVIMGQPFGFMAFLGVISLIGVIVSHIIVLFDFIEEKHEEGEPLREALMDAGILRLRPILITVGATVLGLVPLALHGGPLWEALCYVQIGGLSFATVVTLILVPVLYSIFVLDLKIIKWEKS